MFAMEISLMWILIGLLYQLHNKKYNSKIYTRKLFRAKQFFNRKKCIKGKSRYTQRYKILQYNP